jgi:hypothetical protein
MSSALRALFAVLAIGALPLLMTAQEGDKPAPAETPAAAPAKAYLEIAGKAVGGEWVDQKGIDDPEAPHGRFICTWGVNNKIVLSKTYWANKGKAVQIYDGSTYWHPEKKCAVSFSIGAEGQVHEGTVEEKDGVSIVRFQVLSAAGATDWEQHGKYLDKDTMESTVYVKKDGKLVPSHVFKFHRKEIGFGLKKEVAK